MSFERPWALFLLIVPLLWMILNWRRSSRRGSAITALLLCALVLAVTKAELVFCSSRVAVAVLADTSASISDRDLKHESDLIRDMDAARGDQMLRVIQFARSTRATTQTQSRGLAHASGPDGRATDIERAVRYGITTLPIDRVRRMVILSDGRENVGNVLRAAGKAKELGIPIDTIPLVDVAPPTLRLEMAATPAIVFRAERFPIDFVLTSPRSAPADIVVSSQGNRLDSKHVLLEQGANRVRIATGLAAVGDVQLSVAVHAGSAGELYFSQPVTLRQPRALLISRRGSVVAPRLLDALASAEFEVRRKATIPADFGAEQIVLLNNWNLQGIPLARQASLEEFVAGGGVLAVLEGHRNTFAKAGSREDPLQRMLPATFVPPEARRDSCFVLVLQKSSSMDGKKMELARLAALGIVENLRRNDRVGLLTFADTFEWAVPIQQTSDRDSLDDVIEGLTAGGGTRLAPALHEALRRILAVDSMSKHIVLLTDGRTGDLGGMALATRATVGHVTISTVTLGENENRTELTRVAQRTGGKSYIVNNPGEVEPAVLRDAFGAVSTPLQANLVPKPGARLITSPAPGEPGLMRREYGWGRTEVFTSNVIFDSRRGGSSKVTEFWENAIKDLSHVVPKVEVTAQYDKTNDQFVIDYRFSPQIPIPMMNTDMFAFGPHGFGASVPIKKVSPTALRARVPCHHASGLFRILPMSESSLFPQLRLNRNDQELDDAGPNAPLLQKVSELTGGRFNPVLRSIFDPNGHTAVRKVRLWPALVVVALMLFLVNSIPYRPYHGFARVRSAFNRSGASPRAV